MRKSILTILTLLTISAGSLLLQSFTMPGSTGKDVLTTGSRLELELRYSVNSEADDQGNTIEFEVRTRVSAPNGKILIAEGAPAQGRIRKLVRADESPTGEGYLELEVQSVRAVDGTRVSIRSSSLTKRGNLPQNPYALIESGFLVSATVAEDYLIFGK